RSQAAARSQAPEAPPAAVPPAARPQAAASAEQPGASAPLVAQVPPPPRPQPLPPNLAQPPTPQATGRHGAATPERRQGSPERHELATRYLPVSPRPRPETEDAQSVLARLRQAAPAAPPAELPPPPAERPVRAPSPWLRRLFAARSALAAGRIEGARRLLQQVQLQLVFRPVGAADEAVVASRAAQDVARALDALGGNDLVQSRNYIDRAIGDSNGGSPGASAAGDWVPPRSGYAPAYPPY
ncbi:hypothetical protein CCS01_28655, partial [Rhodopila globiformis]